MRPWCKRPMALAIGSSRQTHLNERCNWAVNRLAEHVLVFLYEVVHLGDALVLPEGLQLSQLLRCNVFQATEALCRGKQRVSDWLSKYTSQVNWHQHKLSNYTGTDIIPPTGHWLV